MRILYQHEYSWTCENILLCHAFHRWMSPISATVFSVIDVCFSCVKLCQGKPKLAHRSKHVFEFERGVCRAKDLGFPKEMIMLSEMDGMCFVTCRLFAWHSFHLGHHSSHFKNHIPWFFVDTVFDRWSTLGEFAQCSARRLLFMSHVMIGCVVLGNESLAFGCSCWSSHGSESL